MVAPSLVTTTAPSGETNSLSIPLGPRELLRVLATDLAASKLDLSASKPFSLFLDPYWLIIMKGLPYSSKANDIFINKIRFNLKFNSMQNYNTQTPFQNNKEAIIKKIEKADI